MCAVNLDTIHAGFDAMLCACHVPLNQLAHLARGELMRDTAAAGAGNRRRGNHVRDHARGQMLASAMIELTDQQRAFGMTDVGQLA